MNIRPSRPIIIAALCVAAAHAAVLAGLGSSENGVLLSNLAQLSAAILTSTAAMMAGRASAGVVRRFWVLVSVSYVLWAAGQAILTYYESVLQQGIPSISAHDIPFLAYYLPLATALLLSEEEKRGVDWLRTLDLAQVGIVLSSVYLYFFFFLASGIPSRASLVEQGYINLYDLSNLTLTAGYFVRWLMSEPGVLRPLYLRLGVLLAVYAAGDGLFTYGLVAWEARTGTWFDLCYSLPLLATAVVAASYQVRGADGGTQRAQPAWARRVSLMLPTMAPLLVLVIAGFVAERHLGLALTCLAGSFACYSGRLALTQFQQSRTLELLQNSEQRFRSMIEKSVDAIALINREGAITYLSPSIERILGHKAEERVGLVALDRVEPEDRERLRENIGRMLRNPGASVSGEYRARHKDGRQIWIEAVGTNLLGDANVQAVVVNFREITSRKQAQAALHASQQRFAKAFESSLSAFAITSQRDQRLLDVNQRWLSLVGFSREEVIGRTAEELNLWELPEERAAMLRELRERGCVLEREVRVRLRTGEIRLVVLSSELIEVDGEPCILWFVDDITERKRAEKSLRDSEEQFSKAFRLSPHAMVISRMEDGRYIDVNQRWLQMIRMSREEVLGKTSVELGLWSDAQERQRLVQKLSETGAVRNEEVTFRSRGGGEFLALLSAEVLELNGERCILSAVQDVTEMRQLEDQLRQVQKLEAIGRLAGGVAHDFNNLLSIILGRCELMEMERSGSEGGVGNVREIQKAAESATALTRQLLAFSRRQVLELKVVDLNAVIADTQSMLGRLIGAHIEIEVSLDPSLGRVRADPGQLEQVLLNLAANARDAMPQGGRLSIRTVNFDMDDFYAHAHRPARAGAYVQLEVRDSGAGMDTDTRARIFEPFFTTKGQGKGTGLGLATVYGIVKQSGGYIWVRSEMGEGTSFLIQLPRVTEMLSEGKSEQAPGGVTRGSETLLVVEDDAGVRSVIREFLVFSGYEVLEASSAAEALEIAGKTERKIHLLVTDLVLPGITGPALSRQFAKLRPRAKVLFISGYSEQAVEQEFQAGRPDAFLQKPFTLAGLTEKVRQVLDTNESTQTRRSATSGA